MSDIVVGLKHTHWLEVEFVASTLLQLLPGHRGRLGWNFGNRWLRLLGRTEMPCMFDWIGGSGYIGAPHGPTLVDPCPPMPRPRSEGEDSSGTRVHE